MSDPNLHSHIDANTTIPDAKSDMSDQDKNQARFIQRRKHKLPKKFSDFAMN